MVRWRDHSPDGLLDRGPVPVGLTQHELGYPGLDPAVVQTVSTRQPDLPRLLLEAERVAAPASLQLLLPRPGLVRQGQARPLPAVSQGTASQCEH